MTKMAAQFINLIKKKAGGRCVGVRSKHLRNLFGLRDHFNCNIYYLTSSTSKGFWNFSEKQLLELKSSTTNRGFVIVFLMDSEYGYLIHGNEIDNHTKNFSFSEEYYKINEEHLRTANIPEFRSIDAFLDLLKQYQVQ